jgi:HK97 family phage portal protein
MAVSSLMRRFEEIDGNSSSFSISEGRKKAEPSRSGFATGVPIGGSTEYNSGESGADGPMDRVSFMESLLQAYMTCTWASAAVDTIARTATAGGLDVVPVSGVYSDLEQVPATPEVKRVQGLLDYVNPSQDIRQLMRGVVTDLLVYGDSFTEIVWSSMGEPVALYPLDPSTMTVLADEHGIVKGYYQRTATNREAWFRPKEVIHVQFDSPGNPLYGVSPTQKAILPITTWLFASALLKETYKRGDPMRAWVDWPIALPESEMKKFQQQYHIRNLGVKNIGNLFETKGGAQVKELGTNQISFWHQTLQERRDEILSAYGVPPSKVGVIEAGNIGGGTGTSQDKMFRVNTVGPLQELVLEKFSFALMYQAYKIKDWTLKFGVVDWRDDETIEKIRDLRLRNGTWTLNRSRSDVGEPPTEGGNKPVLVDRQNMVLWEDLDALSKANLAAAVAQSEPNDGTGAKPLTSGGPGVNATKGPDTTPSTVTKRKPGQSATSGKSPNSPSGSESFQEEDDDQDDGIWEYEDNGSRNLI